MNFIEIIQQWYAGQCNGEWEHEYGIAIDTLDNPGWSVSIDLHGTNLETMNMEPYRKNNGENDWISCEIKDRKFIGNGDSLKLNTILKSFVELIPYDK